MVDTSTIPGYFDEICSVELYTRRPFTGFQINQVKLMEMFI